MKLCCTAMEWNLANLGGEGLAVGVVDYGFDFLFLFLFRAVREDHEAALKAAAITDFKGRITVSLVTGMGFCPWCGTDLTEWSRNNRAAALEACALSKSHCSVPTVHHNSASGKSS